MAHRLGQLVLGLSGAGYPLTQLVIRQFGRRGALIVEGVCVGLAVRDATMIAAGVPTRLRRGPAILLWLELVAAIAAIGLGLRPVVDPAAAKRSGNRQPDRVESARRAAVGALFSLHTLRFRIYLRPDHGLKAAATGSDGIRPARSSAASMPRGS